MGTLGTWEQQPDGRWILVEQIGDQWVPTSGPPMEEVRTAERMSKQGRLAQLGHNKTSAMQPIKGSGAKRN